MLAIRHAGYIRWGVNKSHWRYASTRDLVALMKAHFVSNVFLAATISVFHIQGFPRSIYFTEFALSIILVGGSHLAARLLNEKWMLLSITAKRKRDVIVLGAGDAGHLLVKYLLDNARFEYRPVAVLDDLERLWGATVHGVEVAGPISKLGECLQQYPEVAAVIVAIPTMSKRRLSSIEKVCSAQNVPMKRLHSFEDIACLDGHEEQDKITVESLLQKDVHLNNEKELGAALQGKRVLVTGAGGSIGSELVRQVLKFGPSRVICLDSSEYGTYALGRELETNAASVDRAFYIANVRDMVRLNRILSAEKPDIVFHAAAYKHVPLLEDNPYEAFVNNVVGTNNILRASAEAKVKRFIFISTDKAVDPKSIMGCTKRISELLVREYAQDKTCGMCAANVRFGNVINSAGSVVPLFRKQILSGGPVTVTHPEVERFFMSIGEAVRLVLVAGTLGDSGETYVLDMGKPIRIVDVAKKMLAMYGRRNVPIVFTGLRPGEKLTEELLGEGEKKLKTDFKKVHRVQSQPFDSDLDMRMWVESIRTCLPVTRDEELIDLMRAMAFRTPVKPEKPEPKVRRIGLHLVQ